MKLLGIEAIDVLGVANGVYSFAKTAEQAHDRVLIVGGPGSGKTRLLELLIGARELLTNGVERHFDVMHFIRPENKTSKAILSWQLTPDEQMAIGAPGPAVKTEVIFADEEDAEELDSRMAYLLEQYSHDDRVPKFEYFSEQRRLDIGGGDGSLEESEQAFLRAAPNPRKFAWIPLFLRQLPERPAQAERFARTLEQLSQSCTYELERHTLSSRGRPVRHLSHLSASEADAVMFAATATLVGLSGSIVLVDRPELHGIDPARALAGLGALGKDNQLILATASRAYASNFDGAVIQLDASANPTNRGLG